MDMYRDIGIYREINGYRGIYLFWDKFNKIFHGHKNHLISPVIEKNGNANAPDAKYMKKTRQKAD